MNANKKTARIAGLWYLLLLIVVFFFPGHMAITCPGIAIAAVAEISCILWLLVIGVKNRKPSAVAAG